MSDSLLSESSYRAALISNPLIVRPTAALVTVVEQMNAARIICELGATPLDLTTKLLAEARSSCVLVIDEASTLLGIVTERDLVRLGIEQDNWQTAIAGEVMTRPVLTLSLAELTDMFVVLEQFRLHRIRHLPVLDEEGQVMGLITQESLRLVTRPIDLMRFQTVADAMTHQVITASPRTSLLEVNHLLVKNRISCVVIVEPHGQLENQVRPVGIITERDLVQLRSLHINFADCEVQQAMIYPLVTVQEADTLLVVQNSMETHRIHQVVVRGGAGELLGIVTQTNVLSVLNPWQLFRLTETLEKRVASLESEKIALLENRARDLEQEVQARTRSLEEKHQQERLISSIANQIRSSLALPEILQATVTQIQALFNCDRVAVWQCDDHGILTAIAEAKSNQVRSQLNEVVDDPCFRKKGLENYVSGEMWVVEDFQQQTLTECYRGLIEHLQIRAKILVAIAIEDRLWGLLEASESQCAREWSSHEINIFQSLSTQLAIAIDQAQTHQSLANLTQQLEQRVIERTASLETALQQLQAEVTRRAEVESRQEVLLAELSDFKLALDQAAIVAITDTEGKIIYCNDKLCEISGYSRGELIGQTHRVIKSSQHPPAFYQQMWNTITQGHIWKGEVCNRTKAGQDYWVDTTIIPFCDTKGQPVQYLAIRINVTPRKLAEQALALSENRYRRIVETAHEGIWVLDAQAKTIFANPAIAAMLQTSVKAMMGRSLFDYITPDNQLLAEGLLARRRAGESERHEFCFQRQDGSPLWTMVSASVISDDEGQFLGCLGMVTDITHQKMASEVINQQLACIEAAIDGIGVLKDDKYIYINKSHLALFGYDDPEQLIGQSWRLLYTPEELQRFETEILPVLMQKKYWRGEAKATRRDGSTFIEGLSLTLTDDGGLIFVCRDISAQKLYEETLQLTNRELERATRLKDEFLANMSHELRTPLNAILGLTDGMREEVFGEINEKQRKALNTIHTSSDHLLTLINDILDLSKIEAGKINLQLNSTPIRHLCRVSLDFVKQLAYEKRIQLTLEIPDNLPELSLDERRIRQVLINLLSNAVKFTPEGGKVNLVVSFQAASPTDGFPSPSELAPAYFIRFVVIDTGIGISLQDLGELFQPFVQIDSTLNRQYAGTGLGLALVKRIVELHGGKMEVSSQVGSGSRFGFVLPCPEIVAPLPSLLTSIEGANELFPPALKSPTSTESALILLVEDNEANIQTFSSYLEAKKYRVAVAKDGLAAVDQAKALTPDIILMDIQLPKLDGISAIQRIRAESALARTPIIALTALAMKGDQEKCLAAGANQYLSKPVKLQLLAQTIQRLLTASKPS